jgi:hypothetical protein
MKLEIEDSKALENISEQSNRTSSEIVNAFVKAIHETLDAASSRGRFEDATYDEVSEYIPNNLGVGKNNRRHN